MCDKMTQSISHQMSSIDALKDRALVVFKIHTPTNTSTVHLVGSWDNFSSPLLMTRDTQVAYNVWKVCLGSSRSKTGSQSQGLKMGARYTYYFVLDGLLPTIDSTVTEKQVDGRTGIVCSVLHVPIQVIHSVLVEASTPDLLGHIPENDVLDESQPSASPACGLGLICDGHTAMDSNRHKSKPSPLMLVKRSYSLSRKRDVKPSSHPALSTSCGLYTQGDLDRPLLSPTRLNAPARPKVIIPTSPSSSSGCDASNNSFNNIDCDTPYSSILSLTPSSYMNSAVTPSSAYTPYTPYTPSNRNMRTYGFGRASKDKMFIASPETTDTLSPVGSPTPLSGEKEKRRLGFHIKTPSMPSLSGILGGSKGRSHMPIISNPIPIDMNEPVSVYNRQSPLNRQFSILATSDPVIEARNITHNRVNDFEQYTLEKIPEQNQAPRIQDQNAVPRYMNTSPVSRCTSIDSTSSSFSPSLTQSEFSIASSPSLNRYSSSSISSSVMESGFDSEFELDDEVVGEMYSEDIPAIHVNKSQRSSLKRVDQNDFAEVEAWYRNAAAAKPRSSNNSNVTRMSDMSCVTQFEDLQEVFPNLLVNTSSRNKDRSASPMFYAPRPKRPDNGVIKNMESKIALL